MQALVNAGGKGTRMGACGIEKPMQLVGGIPVVERVVNTLLHSDNIDRVLVSVSDNTLETEKYLKGLNIETIRTSGENFMDDLHDAFGILEGQFVLTCPSDMPFISTAEIDKLIANFDPDKMESLIALTDIKICEKFGIKPSYTMNNYGTECVISGVAVMDRVKTLQGMYLQESFYETDCYEFAVNVNTQEELSQAKDMAD